MNAAAMIADELSNVPSKELAIINKGIQERRDNIEKIRTEEAERKRKCDDVVRKVEKEKEELHQEFSRRMLEVDRKGRAVVEEINGSYPRDAEGRVQRAQDGIDELKLEKERTLQKEDFEEDDNTEEFLEQKKKKRPAPEEEPAQELASSNKKRRMESKSG